MKIPILYPLVYTLGGARYSKTRTMSVLVPGTTTDAGPTYTFYYDGPGSEKLGMMTSIDLSSEVTFPIRAPFVLAVRGEVFNLTDRQTQASVNNSAYCADINGSAACRATREQFGSATSRNSFNSRGAFA